MNMTSITQTPKPTELSPAYERPVDRESIDSRMKAQLDWEAESHRNAPRDIQIEKSGNSAVNLGKIGKKAGAVVAAGAIAFGGIKATERAIDHELDTGQPKIEHTDGMYETGTDKNGNPVRIYPGSGEK